MSLRRDLVKARQRSSNSDTFTARPPTVRNCNSAGSGGRASPSGEAVHVAVRVRPPFRGENAQEVIVAMDPSHKTVYVKGKMDEQQGFSVDMPIWSCVGKALDGSAPISQANLYEMVGKPLLDHALDGFNSTLMAYGQTGSGKTYTMMGDISPNLDDNEDVLNNSEEGIIPRLCREMFQQIQNRSFTASSGGTISWEVHVSFVEVYCEKISDLLNHGTPVTLRDEVVENETYFTLVGARRVEVTNTSDILRALKTGNKCRKTAATAMNERSSRSHAIFIVELTEILSFTNTEGDVVSAPSKSLSIRLVDLAGSERIGETGTSGQQFKEGVEINLSLFTLGMVIESLSDPKRRNIKPPYRESTLTKILKDAFGGNSKTTMICTISPTEAHRGQTIQTLQYGSKARRVVNKPHVEVDPSSVALRKANEEMLALRKQLSEVKRGSKEYEDLHEQVQSVNERLRQEQEISRRRKANLEQKEAELAEHFQKMEEQRLMYDNKIQVLGDEMERVRVKQKQKEREMQKAQRKVESIADKRVKELEAQCETMEKHFKQKGDEMLRTQKETEERLHQLDSVFRSRVDELLQKQKDLESMLKEKERVLNQRERELKERQQHHKDEFQLIEQRMLKQEKEWGERQKVLEEQLRTREDNSRLRLDDALEKSRFIQEEGAKRENELHRKLLEAQRLARQMQEDADFKELELKRQVEEVQREAKLRERDLNERLHQAEHEAKIERETLQRELEANAASTQGKERHMEVHWTLLEDGLKKREELLQKREEEVNARYNDALRMKQEWERVQREKMAELDARQEEAMGVFRSKEILIQQRENELKALTQQLEAQAAAQDIEVKKKEHELSAKINEAELNASRERRAAQRLQDELQKTLERMNTETKQREEQMARWEEEAKNRYAELENSLAEREAVIQRREADIATQERVVEQKQQKENDFKLRKESQQSMGEILLEKCTRSEAATMLEADLKARLASMNCNGEDFATYLRVGEEVLLHRELCYVESTEMHERNTLIKHEGSDWKILMEQVNLDRQNIKLQKRESALTSEKKKFHKKTAALQSWMQFLLIEMEQRCRVLLESSRYREYDLICTLATSTHPSYDTNNSNSNSNSNSEKEEKQEKEEKEEREKEREKEVGSGGAERELRLRAEGLQAEEERLTRRLSAFAAERAAWEAEARRHDGSLLAYVVGLEGLDRAGVREREAEGRAVWAYLRELEADDMRRGQRERGLQRMEEDLTQQLAETEQRLQERAADIDRRRQEATVLAEENERTLLDQEADLAALVARNEGVERQIKQRDAELQQQRHRYVDLRKLLEEREALLRREHAHRMNGKESATQLTDDLLDVNDILKEQLGLWIKKYQILKSEEKLECERCSWQNNRDATVCRCCGETMKSRTWVPQTHSSPRPENYITTDNIETTSGIVYEEPLFTRVNDSDNTSQTQESKDTMEGISTKSTREQDRRWQLEKSRWRSTRQKAVLQPWHRLEQDYEQVETQLLKGRYPNYFFDIQSHNDDHQDQDQVSYVSEPEPTVASMFVVGSKQNSIKRQRSQTGTPMKLNSPIYETSIREIKEGNNDDSIQRQTPPPPPPRPPQPLHSVSPASPLYLDKKIGGNPYEGVSKDSMRLLPTGASAPIPSEVAGLTSSCAPLLSPDSLQLRNVNSQKGTVEGKNGYDILSKSNDFMPVSPPLYIITPPPAIFAADVTPDPRFEQSNEKRKETEKEGDQSNKKQDRKISKERRALRSGLTTPSVACLLQSPPWKTVEQRTPPPKNRMILTPPRSSIANLSTNFDVVSSMSPVFATKELVTCKYQESCTPCTPGKEKTTSLNSPSRPLESIIDTWQGLSAHYKRAKGLKTPVVPLLLKNT